MSLSNIQKITHDFCYTCACENPQFQGKLADNRLVLYCGDCWKSLQEGLKFWSDSQ
jgi:predicted SprT family Zn-dependent metalloprotease